MKLNNKEMNNMFIIIILLSEIYDSNERIRVKIGGNNSIVEVNECFLVNERIMWAEFLDKKSFLMELVVKLRIFFENYCSQNQRSSW
jgi:hypothetical protein